MHAANFSIPATSHPRSPEALEHDHGPGLALLPWRTPHEAARSLAPSARARLSQVRKRIARSWLAVDPQLALAAAVAELDPESRVVVSAGAHGSSRWSVHSFGGAPARGSLPPVLPVPGTMHRLRLMTYGQGRSALTVSLYRALDARPFEAHDHALLFALRPALRHWSRLATVLGPAPLGRGVLAATVTALPLAAVVTCRGCVVFANAEARAALPQVRAWLRSGAPAGFAQRTPLGQSKLGLELVLPRDVPPAPTSRVLLLQQRHGLTRAEARLATRLARGLGMREAALELGIHYETARTHLKRAFAKLGVRRQAQLVSLLCGTGADV